MKFISNLLFGSYTKKFINMYLIFVLLTGLLLILPFSVQEGQSLPYLDAVFISISGISTTGLSTVDIAVVLTPVGQVILAIALQLGGIGLMIFLAAFIILRGKNIDFRYSNMIATEQNQSGVADIARLVKNIAIVLLYIELTCMLIMGTYLFINYGDVFGLFGSYFQAFFGTISMLTNAGFDIDPMNSMVRYQNDYFMQALSMFLMFVGAVGFWPLVECREWFRAKRKGEPYKFSYISKILFKLHLTLWLGSAIIFYGLEFNNSLKGEPVISQVFYSLFMSLTTRNAGFSTMADLNVLSDSTLLIFCVLMIIGSSPNSAGGGIRTTSLYVTIRTFIAYARGKEQVVINKKAMKIETIRKSFLVITGGVFVVFLSCVILMYTETYESANFKSIIFEVSSAFGTTGLSLGITGDLTVTGKLVLIIDMFIGRVGILALLMLMGRHHSNNSIQYPEVDMMVG